MLIFLFIVLIISSVFISYYLTNKMSNQRKQILLLKYQNNNLASKTSNMKSTDIKIKYITCKYNNGIITDNCKLYISPLVDSYVINSLTENTFVQIQDSAEINSELWYEISFVTENRINSKGWIQSKFIKILIEEQQ